MHFYRGMSYRDVMALPLPAFNELRRCAAEIQDEINKQTN